jgi:hypothetical protein
LNFSVTQNMENCEIWKVESGKWKVNIKNNCKAGELKIEFQKLLKRKIFMYFLSESEF